MNPLLVLIGLGALYAWSRGSGDSSSSATGNTWNDGEPIDTSKVPKGSEGRRDLGTLLAPGYTLGNFLVSDGHPELVAAMDPTGQQIDRLAALAVIVSQLAALAGRKLGKQVHLRVTSGLRSAELNAAVDGAVGSQHMAGEAVDLQPPPGLTSADLARLLVDAGVPFDQVIAYTPSQGGHLHVSYTVRRTLRRVVAVQDAGGYHEGPDILDTWKEAA